MTESPTRIATTIESRPLTLLDYALVIWRYKWLLVAVFVIGVLVTAVVVLRQPRIYQSTASILAPRESSNVIGFTAGLLQQLPGIQMPSLAPNRDLFINVLKSRTVAKSVVERFGLQERYRSRHLEDAIRTLQNVTTVSVSTEGLIFITVEETDAVLAAQIANAHVDDLARLVREFGSGDASRQRQFISERLALVTRELEAAEDVYRRFKERNKAIILQDQTRGVIEAAARLKGEIVATEVQLQVMRNFATDTNPNVILLKRRVDEMKRQLTQVEYGDDGFARTREDGRRGEISVPFARVPELSIELARHMREVKTLETVVALLTQQFEHARITEAKDLPAFRVLDPAVPAVSPSKPSVRLSLMIAGAASLLAGLFLVFVVENIRVAAAARA